MPELFKKCPSCGHINPETEIFCQNPACGGTDISLVSVQSPAAPQAGLTSESAGSTAAGIATREVKICPNCGGQNESFAILCVHGDCGAMLEDVVVTRISPGPVAEIPGQRPSGPPKLRLVIGGESHECRNGDVLGRKGTLACHAFQEIPTVSGRHVALELRDSTWFLVNLPPQVGRTGKNVTQLDGRDLGIGEALQLSGEHVLKMSTQCEVKLRVIP